MYAMQCNAIQYNIFMYIYFRLISLTLLTTTTYYMTLHDPAISCKDDPENGCDLIDLYISIFYMLKDQFRERFYDVIFQATFTYSFVGAFNAFEAHLRHVFREYDTTNVIGWNVLVKEHKTGKYRLEMPSEDTCSMKDIFQDDEVLLEKVSGAANDDGHEGFPDFFVLMSTKDDQAEFMRRMVNRVSQSIKSSQWPNYAMSLLQSDASRAENPHMLCVAEKDKGMKTYMMRTWLVFPEVLRIIKQYSEKELNDPDGMFIVSKAHHRIRLVNLRKWAITEDNKNLDESLKSQPFYLPRVPQHHYGRESAGEQEDSRSSVCNGTSSSTHTSTSTPSRSPLRSSPHSPPPSLTRRRSSRLHG
jgi:hypothetical protein